MVIPVLGRPLALASALGMIRRGEIQDAKTIIGLMLAKASLMGAP